MCGILALQNLDGSPVDAELMLRMRDEMIHRGPDDCGLHIDRDTGLAHRRLSILDLSSAGHQPMCNEDGTIWITFNGEIYNFVELMADLRARGHVFRSQCDTEVIVHLYEEYGTACVEHLNGMFAFMIWDATKRRLFGARDRIGIKPLYYRMERARFAAASEVKALLADPSAPRRPDMEGLAGWMFAGAPLGGRTCFAGIREIPPGTLFELADGHLSFRSYWSPEYSADASISFAEAADVLAELLDDAVRVHSRSDARLGCHLSGGLDSSTVAVLTSRHRPPPLHTFSIRFEGGRFFDETPYARAVAEQIGSEHHVHAPTAADFDRLLPRLVWHMDAPLTGATAFSYYSVAKLAREHVTVAMTGHGGDEVFAGYPAQFLAAYGSADMFDLSDRPSSRLPLTDRLRLSLVRRMRGRRNGATLTGLEQLWIRSHCGQPPHRDPLLADAWIQSLGGYDPVDEYLTPLRDVRASEVLGQCLHHDLRQYLPLLLHAEDRASMAVSLESRVPLLDHRVVEYACRLPADVLTSERMPKALLRQVARRWVPAKVFERRDKGAFAVPAAHWLRTDLAPRLRHVLSDRRTIDRGLYAPALLRSGTVARASGLAALSLELWFRLFIDQDRDLLAHVHDDRQLTAVPAVGASGRQAPW